MRIADCLKSLGGFLLEPRARVEQMDPEKVQFFRKMTLDDAKMTTDGGFGPRKNPTKYSFEAS